MGQTELTGPGAPYAWRGFTDADWQGIEVAVGGAFDAEMRAAVADAAELYLVARWVRHDDGRRTRLRGRVDRTGKVKDATGPRRLLTAMERLIEVWSEVYGDSEARDLLNIYDAGLTATGDRDLLETMGELQFHQRALAVHLKPTKRRDPFASLVRRLAAVFYQCTGRRPTVANPPDTEDPDAPVSPFVRFVKAVDGAMPPAVRRRNAADTAAAWSRAVSRALQDNLAGK